MVKNILKYLKRTKDMFLVYGGDEELVVNGYVDASFDTDLDDSKSQTVTTLELLPLPRSPGFTRRPGTSSIVSSPSVKMFKMDT